MLSYWSISHSPCQVFCETATDGFCGTKLAKDGAYVPRASREPYASIIDRIIGIRKTEDGIRLQHARIFSSQIKNRNTRLCIVKSNTSTLSFRACWPGSPARSKLAAPRNCQTNAIAMRCFPPVLINDSNLEIKDFDTMKDEDPIEFACFTTGANL